MFGDMTRNQFLSQVKSPDWLVQNSILHGKINYCKIQWIGLRENLQETIDFPIKYGVNQSIEKSHFWRAEFSGETFFRAAPPLTPPWDFRASPDGWKKCLNFHGKAMLFGDSSTCQRHGWDHLVGGWAYPLKNMSQLGSWQSQYMEKSNCCSKPPTRIGLRKCWKGKCQAAKSLLGSF